MARGDLAVIPRREEGVPVSDNEVAMPKEAVDAAAVAALIAPVPETVGGAELVQLLTPEGERVEHPEYSAYIADLTD